jgi:hypothetical protein
LTPRKRARLHRLHASHQRPRICHPPQALPPRPDAPARGTHPGPR